MTIPTLSLPSGASIPTLGLGTWCMGESRASQQAERAVVSHAISADITLIDTAEMYGEGGAEEMLSAAIAPHRDSLFLVSKVYPHHASYQGVMAACDRSLRRLKTDYLDLYLLHWRGSYPLAETLAAFHDLKQAGKIREFGVSNFDRDDMEEAYALPHGQDIAVNQVLYNLSRRGIEWDLMPWCQDHQIPIMAYSPLEQGRILGHPTLKAIAQRHRATPAQIAIAWLLRQPNLITIPKSATPQRITANIGAQSIQLTPTDLEQLEHSFPAPTQAMPLAVL